MLGYLLFCGLIVIILQKMPPRKTLNPNTWQASSNNQDPMVEESGDELPPASPPPPWGEGEGIHLLLQTMVEQQRAMNEQIAGQNESQTAMQPKS